MEILVNTDELFESFRCDVKTQQILNEGLTGIIGNIIKAFVTFIKKIFETIFGIIKKIFEMISGRGGSGGGSIASKNGFKHKKDYPNQSTDSKIYFYNYESFIYAITKTYNSIYQYTEGCMDMAINIYNKYREIGEKASNDIRSGKLDKEDLAKQLSKDNFFNLINNEMKDTKFTQFFKTFDIKPENYDEPFKYIDDFSDKMIDLMYKECFKSIIRYKDDLIPDPLDLQNRVKSLSDTMMTDTKNISKKVNDVIKKMENINNLKINFDNEKLQSLFGNILKELTVDLSNILKENIRNIYYYTVGFHKSCIKDIVEFNEVCHKVLNGEANNKEYNLIDREEDD